MTATTTASTEWVMTVEGSPMCAERITLRELRECAFRALVASGSRPGEASGMAEQVLDAELHDGVGLLGLAEELAALGPSGRWPGVGASCSRASDGASLRVGAHGRRGVLQLGSLLADLVAGEPGPATAVVEGEDLTPGPLWDAVLLRAAAVRQGPLAVVATGDGVTPVARVATPDGGLISGVVDEWARAGGAAPGVVVTSRPVSLLDPVGSTGAQRAARRSDAARRGLLVDPEPWARCREVARRYLVPSS